MWHRHVGPVVPRRDANLLREIVHTINRSTLIAADDDESAIDAEKRVVHHLQKVRFPFAVDSRRIDLAVFYQPFDQRTFS